MTELSLPEKVEAIHDRLEAAKIPHAFGGALALASYATPRVTIDIDVNVFVEIDRFSDVSNALEPLGVEVGVDLTVLDRDGQCRLRWGPNPVDLFFTHDEFHAAMRRATRKMPFRGDRIPVLSPEHLLICKAAFDRPKDWLDIEQMLVDVPHLDLAEIRSWLDRIVGEEDPRKQRFEELAAQVHGA